MYRNIFHNTIQKYHNFKHIYTATLYKIDNSVEMPIITENSTTSYILPQECSIYTADALAVNKAIKYTIKNKGITI